jgi:hypothetical protein
MLSPSQNQAETSAAQALPHDLPNWSWWGIIASAVGAQLCCGIPSLLLALGVSSSLLAPLSILRPYRPLFLWAALFFLLSGLLSLWRARRRGCPLPQQRNSNE